jgi:hypothetical protein
MYDVIFLADIYVPGGTNFQLAQNIKYLSSIEKRVGLIPAQLPHAQGQKPINRFIREAISGGHCEVISQMGEVSRTHLFAIDNPRLLTGEPDIKAKVAATRNVILIPFPPRDGNGEVTFDANQVVEAAEAISSGDFTWAPVSNLVRTQLKKFVPEVPLSERNAHPIIDTSAYRFSSEIRHKRKITVGRHSRPEKDKWPTGRAAFLKIYPTTAPFEVSFLGIDPQSLTSMIGGIPANYRALPYDSVSPSEFLGTIDFFVYYHSKSWVEAFGIVVAEAMAAGALCVLPRYMEQNFGDAAVYASAGEVRDTLLRHHRRERDYRDRTRFARKFVQREFSMARFGDFLAEFDIAPGRSKTIAFPKLKRYDAVYASDFSSPKIFNYTFFEEVADRASAGRKIALRDLRGAANGRAPFVGRGLAGVDVLDKDQRVECDELIVNDPWRAVANATDLGHIRSKKATLLVSYPHGDVGQIQRYFARNGRASTETVWAPRDVHCRMWLESFDPNLKMPATNWPLSISPATTRFVEDYRRQRPATPRRTIGFLGLETADEVKWLGTILPHLDNGIPPILTCYGEKANEPTMDPRVICAGYAAFDLVKWVAKLDCLIIARDRLKADNLDFVVALCRTAGIPIFYRSRHNKEKGIGARSLEGIEPADLPRLILGDDLPIQPGALSEMRRQKSRPVVVRRLSEPKPGKTARGINGVRVALKRKADRPALMFVSQNGTGVGHVVRQLAIARKLSSDYDCLFLTMSQAVPFIAAFGFHTEYFPSSVYSGVSYTDWLYWLRKKADIMLDAWDVRSIVFDGNVPYAGVAEAASARRDVRSVWIRRGMWPDSEIDRKRIAAQTYFDMVIEPGEFAEECDTGPTLYVRDTVRLVPPIQLLDQEEILPRNEACCVLGLDRSSVNVLIQLGSGNNRDTQTLLRRVAATAAAHDGVKLYNLRWPISDLPAMNIAGIPDLAVFPMARFYRAFDFSISAAGYNTAHEVLSYRLPTIFVPNETEGMDNQAGRADYSAAHGLALSGGAAALSANIVRMLDPQFRKRMRERLRRLNLENGAAAAARHIDELTRLEG